MYLAAWKAFPRPPELVRSLTGDRWSERTHQGASQGRGVTISPFAFKGRMRVRVPGGGRWFVLYLLCKEE